MSVASVIVQTTLEPLARGLGRLPTRHQRGLARAASRIVHRFLRDRRRIAMVNLAIVPEAPPPSIIPRVVENMALTAQEFLVEEDCRMEVAQECRPIYHRLLKHKGGIIFVSGHLGNWEVLGAQAHDIGLGVTAVARPLSSPAVDHWVNARRSRFGQGVISTYDNPLRQTLRCIRSNRNVVLLVDQRPRGRAIDVRFLNTIASTTLAPAILAARTGAPIVPACAVRTGQHNSLQILFSEPIFPRISKRRDESELRRMTQAFSDALSGWIRQYPDQWLWLHRRWPKDRYRKKMAPLELSGLKGSSS